MRLRRWVVVALFALGCGCSVINKPAAAIAQDLPLYMGLVAPASTLTTVEAVKVEELGRRLAHNAELLRQATE